MSELFDRTKLNLERTIQNLTTKQNEFFYSDTESLVPPGKQYSIYYTNDKSEFFFTGILNSNFVRQIQTLRPTIYEKYNVLKKPRREIYPEEISPKMTDKDYEKGTKQRFFVQLANDFKSPVLEISKSDFSKDLNLYNKIVIDWKISGLRKEVEEQNNITIDNTERNYPGFKQKVFPLQFWKPSKGSIDDIENKLSRLKK